MSLRRFASRLAAMAGLMALAAGTGLIAHRFGVGPSGSAIWAGLAALGTYGLTASVCRVPARPGDRTRMACPFEPAA